MEWCANSEASGAGRLQDGPREGRRRCGRQKAGETPGKADGSTGDVLLEPASQGEGPWCFSSALRAEPRGSRLTATMACPLGLGAHRKGFGAGCRQRDACRARAAVAPRCWRPIGWGRPAHDAVLQVMAVALLRRRWRCIVARPGCVNKCANVSSTAGGTACSCSPLSTLSTESR